MLLNLLLYFPAAEHNKVHVVKEAFSISYYLNENCPFRAEAQTAAKLRLRKDLFVSCS